MSGDGGDVVIKAGSGGGTGDTWRIPIQERLRRVMAAALKEGLKPEDFEEIAREALVEQIMDE